MDIYAEVTSRIIDQMEQGIIPWQKPWIASGQAISRSTGKPYSLLNQMILGKPGEYVTFKQCQAEGGKVRKGEKSQMVVFWKFIEQEDEETHEKKQVPFLRYYSVFHIDQCEGLKAKHTKPLAQTANPDEAADRTGFPDFSGMETRNEQTSRQNDLLLLGASIAVLVAGLIIAGKYNSRLQ